MVDKDVIIAACIDMLHAGGWIDDEDIIDSVVWYAKQIDSAVVHDDIRRTIIDVLNDYDR